MSTMTAEQIAALRDAAFHTWLVLGELLTGEPVKTHRDEIKWCYDALAAALDKD